MSAESLGRTSPSLLARLRDVERDQEAWAELVRRYGRQVLLWCRAWGLQDADAEDVAQTVLARLAEKMREFTYDPSRSFRAYLKTLTRYAWCDFLEGRDRHGAGTGDSVVLERLKSLEARDDLGHRLEAEFDREVLEEAMERVRGRVEPHTWEAFRLTALEGLNGAEVAERLSLKVATVYKARSKVQQMLQEEVRGTDD
jgi:RNA polymerase sigma-70 factor (ECF subfamily)